MRLSPTLKMVERSKGPTILVLASLFPSPARPQAGVFIRERMFRVAEKLPLIVVSPQPWFPFQYLIRRFRPHFRPNAPRYEIQQGIEVYRPRFFSVPGGFKHWDGFFMALACLPLLRRLKRQQGFDLIDSHFAYPEGYAAFLLGRWLKVPVTITLRGTEVPLSRDPGRKKRLLEALSGASQVFSVSRSLKDHVVSLGADEKKIEVIGNGVDTEKFHPVDRQQSRRQLDIPQDAEVLITVGALVPRKGQLRVLEILPELLRKHPRLIYLIVGGASPEGDIGARLRARARELGLERHVRFLGPMAPEELKTPLSASDVFVLATSNEGWANVFLEAMACGLPVVTTDVGGNREVVSHDGLGVVVRLGDAKALQAAVEQALEFQWDRNRILAHARRNDWNGRVERLVSKFVEVTG